MAKAKTAENGAKPRKTATGKHPGGRPSWKPTDEQRRMVMVCMATGFTQEEVASVLGVDHDTLVKHCKRELDSGHQVINAEISGKLASKCLEGDTAALIFWHKVRRGWKETAVQELAGSVGLRHEEALRALD